MCTQIYFNKLIISDSKDFYIVTKNLFLYSELSIHQSILEKTRKMLSSTTVVNID